MTDERKTFEERLQEGQDIIARIEEGSLPLEESMKQFEAGMKTLEELDAEIRDMNRRLTVLQNGSEQDMNRSGENDEDL